MVAQYKILLRKGRFASMVNARDQFIRKAVLEQGYLASQVAHFLIGTQQTSAAHCKHLVELGRSDSAPLFSLPRISGMRTRREFFNLGQFA